MPFKIIWIVYKYILKVLHLSPQFISIAKKENEVQQRDDKGVCRLS